MDTFWINQGAPNDELWAHEHATCTSTFDVACYERGYKEHQEVVNLFETAMKVFQTYPTYNIAGISPSNTTTYTLSRITNAPYSQTGAIPYLGCNNNGLVLDEDQYRHLKTINSTTPSTCNEGDMNDLMDQSV